MIPMNVPSVTCTSKYGWRTYTLNGKQVKDYHHGIDLVPTHAVDDPEVVATADGIVMQVVNVGKKGGKMCLVRIKHKEYQTAYYHLKSGSIKVQKGDIVKKGQVIGIMGNTGNVTGKHLHYQIDKGSNNSSINPWDYVFGDKEVVGIYDAPTTGLYRVQSARYIRTGAGTEYRIKKVCELTKDGQNHCVNKNKNAKAQYEVGTPFNVYEIKYAKNLSIWGRTPSGWICLESHTGTIYCKKV